MTTQVTALFDDRFTAHAAVEQLVQAGFARDELSLVMSEEVYAREFALKSGSGGVLGALVASLAALDGGVMATGPILRELARGGAATAKAIEDSLQYGGILAFVLATGDRASLAAKLLELSGGHALMAA
jgi:hypothetical protein